MSHALGWIAPETETDNLVETYVLISAIFRALETWKAACLWSSVWQPSLLVASLQVRIMQKKTSQLQHTWLNVDKYFTLRVVTIHVFVAEQTNLFKSKPYILYVITSCPLVYLSSCRDKHHISYSSCQGCLCLRESWYHISIRAIPIFNIQDWHHKSVSINTFFQWLLKKGYQ